MRALLLSAAAVFVALALGLSHGNLDLRALALVLAAALLAAGALRAGEIPPGASLERLCALALGLGLAAGLAHNLLRQPGWHATHAAAPALRPLLALAAAVAATHLWPGPGRRGRRAPRARARGPRARPAGRG